MFDSPLGSIMDLYNKIIWFMQSFSRNLDQLASNINNLPYDVGLIIIMIIVIDVIFVLIVMYLYKKNNMGSNSWLFFVLPIILAIPFYSYGYNFFERERTEIINMNGNNANQTRLEYEIEARRNKFISGGYHVYRQDIDKEHKVVLTIDPPISNFAIIGFGFAIQAFIIFLTLFESAVFLVISFKRR